MKDVFISWYINHSFYSDHWKNCSLFDIACVFDDIEEIFVEYLFNRKEKRESSNCIWLTLSLCVVLHSLLLNRLSKRKISAVWGKRLIKSWGKRSESDSDELYQHLLRELHHTARFNQLAHPRYSSYNDCKLIGKEKTSSLCSLWCISSVCFSVDPLTLERLLAQRPTWNNDNDNTAENLS